MGVILVFSTAVCVEVSMETIVFYVRSPEGIMFGKANYYASVHVRGGLARGILVKTQMGRPTKIEGNPDHPASLGASDCFAQVSILELYDPDRARAIM